MTTESMNLNVQWIEDGNFLNATVRTPNEAGELDENTGAYLAIEINKITGWVRVEYNDHPGAVPSEIVQGRPEWAGARVTIENQVVDWSDPIQAWKLQAFALAQLGECLLDASNF